MYGNENSKKIISTTYTEPREYTLPKNIEVDLEGRLAKLEFSETGNFLFAVSANSFCVYDRDKENPIYKYKKQEGDRKYLYETQV